VLPQSNRVGMRLDGTPLQRSRQGELPSEGTVAGALQVPPEGLPVLFLADHPITGGYPVIAVVVDSQLDLAAQVPIGGRIRFRWVESATTKLHPTEHAPTDEEASN
jgi:allophanate hydrolase subunit 2